MCFRQDASTSLPFRSGVPFMQRSLSRFLSGLHSFHYPSLHYRFVYLHQPQHRTAKVVSPSARASQRTTHKAGCGLTSASTALVVINLPMPPCTSRTRFLPQAFALAFRLTTFAPLRGSQRTIKKVCFYSPAAFCPNPTHN